MNYFEFLEWYHLQENDESWKKFCEYREIAVIKGEAEAIKTFEL